MQVLLDCDSVQHRKIKLMPPQSLESAEPQVRRQLERRTDDVKRIICDARHPALQKTGFETDDHVLSTAHNQKRKIPATLTGAPDFQHPIQQPGKRRHFPQQRVVQHSLPDLLAQRGQLHWRGRRLAYLLKKIDSGLGKRARYKRLDFGTQFARRHRPCVVRHGTDCSLSESDMYRTE